MFSSCCVCCWLLLLLLLLLLLRLWAATFHRHQSIVAVSLIRSTRDRREAEWTDGVR